MIPLVKPPIKVLKDSMQSKTRASHLNISDYLYYTDKGQNEMVDLVELSTKYPTCPN